MKQSKFQLLSDENCLKLDNWVNKHLITRFFTSFIALAFFYGTFLFFYEIKFLRELIPVVHPVLIAWAGGLALYNLIIRKLYTKLPYWKIFFLFLISAGITAVITLETGIVSNIKTWILVALPLFAFYPVCLQTENTKKALMLSTLGASIVIFIASLTAIVMYLARFSDTVTFLGLEETLGFIYYIPDDPSSGVILYGAYVDTNHASVYSLTFATISVILFIFCKKGIFSKNWQNKLGKIFAIANLSVQLIYFPLANSRGGWLSLIIALFVVSFLLFSSKLTLKKQALKSLMALALSIVCVATMVLGLFALRAGASQAPIVAEKAIVYIHKLIDFGDDDKPQTPTVDKDKEQMPSADKFEKTDDGTGAGRLTIWKESLELYVNHPIFGVGPNNTEYFGMKHNISGDKIKYGTAIHNSYLDLLVEYGIVGFGILISFWAICLVKVVKDLLKNGAKKDVSYYACAFALLFISGGSALLSCVFVNTTAMYFMMLVLVGYLLSQTNIKGCGKDKLAKN